MKLYFLFLLTFSGLSYSKVVIMTHVYNRVDFIDTHEKTFRAFLKDPYEYVVFNDAANNDMRIKIEQKCRELNIRCFRVPDHTSDRQTPSYRHMDGIRYSFNTIGFDHDDILVMIDADMFLVKPFSIVGYMNGFDLAAVRQTRMAGNKEILYIAPSLVFMNMKSLPNKRQISFESIRVDDVPTDVGGFMYHYFNNNPSLRFRLFDPYTVTGLPMNADALKTLGYDVNTIDLILNARRFEYYLNGTFIHYYAGTNWPGYSEAFLAEKNKQFFRFIDVQLSYYATQNNISLG